MQYDFCKSQSTMRWFFGGNQCLRISQKVLMADGSCKQIKNIKVGDLVLGYDIKTGISSPVKVSKVYNNGTKDIYRTTFNDGDFIDSTINHVFPVRLVSGKFAYSSTSKKNVVRIYKKKLSELIGRLDYSIPRKTRMLQSKHVVFNSHVTLPIEPYSMGCLLGDGSLLKSISLTSQDDCISNRVIKELKELYSYVHENKTSKSTTYTFRGSKKLVSIINDLKLRYKKSGDKFIPSIYKHASKNDRLELIAGLIDTDGCKECFVSKSKRLATDFAFVIKSLGGRAVVISKKKQCTNNGVWGVYWFVSWYLDIRVPLLLKYKQYELKDRSVDHTSKIVSSINLVGKDKTGCIEINHKDHCFVLDNFIVVGNSGKTHTNMIDLAQLVLNIHPFEKISNGVHWACIESWEQVRDILWEENLKKFIMPHHISQIRYGQDKVPRKIFLKNGNSIEFKAFNQGRELFQGRAINSCHCDEQCRHDFQGILNEIQARLMAKDGRLSWSMTPIIPQAFLEERIEDLPDTDEVFYANLNSNRISAGGYIPDKRINEMIAEWPEEVQATRIEGRFAAFYGAVYKTFNRKIHVINPFEISEKWNKYRSFDFGFTNPFVSLWLAQDDDNNWIVYREYYRAKTGIEEHIRNVKKYSGNESYIASFADPENASDRSEMRKAGIPTKSARKDVAKGIETVQGKLKTKENGKPSLFIFNTCRNTCREIASYHYPEGTKANNPKDVPMSKNDHTCDALRYVIYSVERPAAKGHIYAA